MTVSIQVKGEKLQHADTFFRSTNILMFSTLNVEVCIKLIFVGMNLMTLDEDERVKGGDRDKVTMKY